MRWLLAVFVIVPILELYLLLYVGQALGFWPTLALTLGTGIIGSVVAKREGLKVLAEWRLSFERLEPPNVGVIDGVLVLLGGALLITPGVLTDVVGICFLLPWTRRRLAAKIRAFVTRRFENTVKTSGFAGAPPWTASPWAKPVPSRGKHGTVETTGHEVEPGALPRGPAN